MTCIPEHTPLPVENMCSPGCPGTHSVDQAGLKLRDLPASAFLSAGIKGVGYHTRFVLVLFNSTLQGIF
ncbi:hypothetical protein I79_014842 [Cricetulus griseus]|uniref:Uncharacterized protein n=1 Tax=Cricetulus griseus TaxID=10029 RepID=G3HV65_CRIGR|nr:hypothetical protein I79_014842 [Cricetulus griseus]